MATATIPTNTPTEQHRMPTGAALAALRRRRALYAP